MKDPDDQIGFDTSSQKQIMTPEEVAHFLQRSVSWVYRHSLDLGAVKLGGSLFFPSREDLYEYLFCEGQRMALRRNNKRPTLYTGAWFSTKRAAKQARNQRRKEVESPPVVVQVPTDMGFLDLLNRRLDYVRAYNSERHYLDYKYMAKRWVERWGKRPCEQITADMVQDFILLRGKVSPNTANKEIRYLRATFNFGKKKGWILKNPTDGIEFLPVKKTLRFMPSPSQLYRLLKVAESDRWLKDRFPDTAEYLWTLMETLGRMTEINRLAWADVNLRARYVVLHTRKKRGGDLTPRKVPMTHRLFQILESRHKRRDPAIPWVFWNPRTRRPYLDRKKIMKRLCEKAEIPYFRFHALRHSGASVMDDANVPVGSIQRILGHENRKTTEIYLHGLGESERRAVEIYEKARAISHTDSHTVVQFPKIQSG